MDKSLREKIYAGILGKAIGVRLGAPVEPYQWTYELIRECFGDIRGYVKDSERFAADDDTNGPVFFIRSLIDYETGLSYESIANTWLNYARDGEGMFWWGGEGISTEHTAYNNLKKGILPPESGASSKNGKCLSEQVGGQIFIDSWGYVSLGDIDKAITLAEMAASVSHDGEALEGAKFIAGCIAGADFIKEPIDLVRTVLGKLDENSEYVRTLNDVLAYCLANMDDFRKAYDYVAKNYSYEKYEGACHIIPNACIVLIGLIYSKGDFARAIEITVMCGWDTDSNAGVVGSIMGVMKGIDGIDWHYREPINDLIIASSMSPYLNYVDLPLFAELLAELSGTLVLEEKAYANTKEIRRKSLDKLDKFLTNDIFMDFAIKGSSHGLKIINDFRLVKDRCTRESLDGFNALVDNLVKGDFCGIYLKTMYMKDDFPDNRYDPVLMPRVNVGKNVEFTVLSENIFIDALEYAPFIDLSNGKRKFLADFTLLKAGVEKKIKIKIPETDGYLVEKVGIGLRTMAEPIDGNGLLARFIVKSIKIYGKEAYKVDFTKQEVGFLENVTPFSNHRIKTVLCGDRLGFEAFKERGLSLTGAYYTKSLRLKVKFVDVLGAVNICFRVKGLENYYYFEISKDELRLCRRLHLKEEVLKSWRRNKGAVGEVELKLGLNAVKLSLSDGEVYEYEGIENAYGHFGFGGKEAKFSISDLEIEND